MGKSYIYRIIGKDQYKVTRIDNTKPKGEKDRFKDYIVDLRKGDMLCECESFYYRKKACKHIKFILEQVQAKGGILQQEQEGDYDMLVKEINNNEKE